MPVLLLLVLMLIAVPTTVLADTQFNYDGFFSRMKKSEKAEFSDITLAFLLQKQGTTEVCDIEQADITTDISSEPLTLASNGELILPYSELLNRRKALIKIRQPDTAVPCDLNFRLRSKIALDASISWASLLKLHQQFDALLQDLAGLGKYFLPPMTGVSIHFNTDVTLLQAPATLQNRIRCQSQICHVQLLPALSAEDLADPLESVTFSSAPSYLVPMLTRQ